MNRIVSIDENAIQRAYERYAPVYDATFGVITAIGRRHVVEHVNTRRGRVLEVGAGTGISLPHYRRDLKITAIDLSAPMLERARARVRAQDLSNVEEVLEMDAAQMSFTDATFDTVVAMYVLTVVPDPAKVMHELERICAPGGEVVIVSHFSQEHGVRGWLERRLAPLAARLGWRPQFPIEQVLVSDGLRLVEQRSLRPFGIFTMLRFVREGEPAG